MISRFLVAAACLFGFVMAASAETADGRFQKLIDEIWTYWIAQSPEWGTYLGKRDGLDRWTDSSFEAIAKRDEKTRYFLAELEKIPANELTLSKQLDYQLLLRDYRMNVEGQRFPGELLVIDQMGGVHQSVTELMDAVPAERREDFDAILARLKAVPILVDQNIALLKRGLELGVTPPRVTLRDIPGQLDKLIAIDSLENPILAPFQKAPPLLSEEQWKSYQSLGLEILRSSVLPSLRQLRAFLADTYIPKARETIGMSDLPDGKEWYALSVRESTTTDLSPAEIHQIGLSEVARIRSEMEAVAARTEFKGKLKDFIQYLRTDPSFYYNDAESLLAGYRDICKRADAELPRFFGKLPRLTYGVKAIPEYAASSKPAAYYEAGSLEGGRPAYFAANTYDLAARPKWGMEVLTLHEAVPGHHLQIALAQEMGEKPELLRHRSYTAYVEGWGLYSELLGKEMGFYTDRYSEFGRLAFEIWRAARLVVDTGIHAKGWTREQALEYFRENTALSEQDIVVEVDRYIVWPAQALAYKIGERKIRELRARAEKALGEKFNVRAFHDAVLDEGAIPLDVLEEKIDRWIETMK